MALREDFGRGDSARIYDHLNEIARGTNKIGETWRGIVPQGAGNIRVNNNQNFAPQMFTTMDPRPSRQATGRAMTFAPGPYELGFQVNWDSLPVDGMVWCGIQMNAEDSGSDYFGNLTGIQIAESPPVAIRAGQGMPTWPGVTAIARCQVDLGLNHKVMFWLRHENTTNGSTLDFRRSLLRTFAWATRLGH